MKTHFEMMAEYNAWANARLYQMAAQLPDEGYRRDVGVYFKSLHGTLNHLLATDLIWLRRLTGTGEHPTKLNAIVFDDLPSFTLARRDTDARIVDFVRGLSAESFEQVVDYHSIAGVPQKNPLRELLAHLFNHQTHHRGQAHSALTVLGVAEPESLDVLIMLREKAS